MDKSSIFLLPLVDISKNKYSSIQKVYACSEHIVLTSNYQFIIIETSNTDEELLKEKAVTSSYAYSKNNKPFVIAKIPPNYLKDYKLMLRGDYTKISGTTRGKIKRFRDNMQHRNYLNGVFNPTDKQKKEYYKKHRKQIDDIAKKVKPEITDVIITYDKLINTRNGSDVKTVTETAKKFTFDNRPYGNTYVESDEDKKQFDDLYENVADYVRDVEEGLMSNVFKG
jgi:hypothetical protein